MSTITGGQGNIITNGLVLRLDAANPRSYQSGSLMWNDLSGNVNNGTLTNGPTFNTGSGGSIVFDGVDDYVDCNNTIGNFGTSSFTCNFWIYPLISSLSSNKEYGIINKNNNFQNSQGWAIELSTWGHTYPFPIIDILSFNTGEPIFGIGLVSTPISTGTWSNFNLIRTGNKFDSYINGNLSSTSTSSGVGLNVDNSVNLTIAKQSSWQQYFKGNISTTQLYNRALSSSEVLQNYNATRARFGV
jgi:hypothetical protein